MNTSIVRAAGVAFIAVVLALVLGDTAVWGQRGGGRGGGARAGGGAARGGGGVSRPAGGAVARPAGGGVSRPTGGMGASRPSGGLPNAGTINRSPSLGAPNVRPPIADRPNIKAGGGGVGGAFDRPGVIQGPGLQPGTRPDIGAGKGIGSNPKIGGGKGAVDPGFGKGIGSNPKIGGGKGAIDPGFGKAGSGIGNRPGPGAGGSSGLLPGLGLGVGAGAVSGKAGDYLGRRQGNVQDRKSNVADRSQNVQDRLDQRQDYRNMRQDQRQDFANNRREDWQNWHDDYYGQHDGWYHGGWCDHWGNSWDHMWSDHTAAMVLGTTVWGLNRMSYWFGYGSYTNPYYSEPLVVDNTTIYYSEPMAAPPAQTVVAAPAQEAAALPPGVTDEGMKHFDAARNAFYGGNLREALAFTNKALASMPTDAVIHEFRALVLFTMGNYKEAAMTLHSVLAVGPGWDWTTMSSLFPGNYSPHLRNLETYVTEHPKEAEAHFVLGYHYLTLGHTDVAIKELEEVRKLVPGDTVTAQLLQMLGKSGKAPEPPAESDVKIDTAKMMGSWKATRGSKATFELTLDKDKSFTWTYQEGKKKEQVKGAYALNGNVLALEPDAGGVMLAEVTEPQGGAFTFRVLGAPKTDPGLTFRQK
jgi:tetratricopeptide (TPR) repeat protein